MIKKKDEQSLINDLTYSSPSIFGESGIIKNYTWTLRDDGGFDCSVEIVSKNVALIGEDLDDALKGKIVENFDTRDHTEILLKYLGAPIGIKKIGNKKIISLKGYHEMQSFDINVPPDPSNACFFIVQTLCMQKSKIKLKNVCINYFRTGFIDILNKMGAKIKIFNKRKIKGEYVADILVKSKKLKNISVPKSIIPRTIDELPVLFVICALSKGKAKFNGIAELRIKESDRIAAMEKGLNVIGIKTESTRDTLTIYGNPKIKFQKKISVSTNLDHRIAMSFFILGQALGSRMIINGFESVNSSFPNFLKLQKKLGAKYEIKK